MPLSCINNTATFKTRMKKYYTYAYLREDKTPYYIGKGTGDRVYYRARFDIKPPKDKSRIIFLKQNLSEKEAFKHEIYIIAVFGRIDLGTGILHNKTDGGDNPPSWKGKTHSSETRKKLSQINKGNQHRLGHKLPPEKLKPKKIKELKGKNSKILLKGNSRTEKQKDASNNHSKIMRNHTPWNKGKVGLKGPIKPCVYKGIQFNSRTEAASHFDVTVSAVTMWVKKHSN